MGRPVTVPRSGRPTGRLLFVAANPSIDRLYEVDKLVAGEIHRPESTVAVPGGKGLNAARAAATLGGSVKAVGIVAGRAGDWIVERLGELGIDAAMARSSGETRTCISVLDRSSGELTEIYERGETIEPAAWEELERLIATELDRGDVAAVALSGSLPPGAPPDGFGRIAQRAAAGTRPVPVVADTYGTALTAVLVAHAAIVKVNAGEAGEATSIAVSDPRSAAAAAAILLDMGAACAVVTLGIRGAVVASAGGRFRLVPPDVRGAFSVGSGDAFLGGVAVAHARGESLVEAARLGMAAGIANAQLPGAGNLDPIAIERLLDRIEAVPI
jgi:1-phosphofructokinase family hexose kinase